MMVERIKNTNISWRLDGCCTLRPRRELPDDLLFEVLLRLPIKQLLKCMCVSKFWCSIIRQSKFMQAYSSRNPFCLLLSIETQDNIFMLPRHLRIYCSNIVPSGQEEEFFNLFNFTLYDAKTGNNYHSYHGFTNMINGFFCGYMRNKCLMLVNVFTGQATQLPCIDFPHCGSARYYFGFVPSSGLYKLLCASVWGEYHILTIAVSDQHFSWKRLRLPRGYGELFLGGDCILVNGAFYWIQTVCPEFSDFDYRIACFDLTKEKFTDKYINVSFEDFPGKPRLVQYRGKLSLFYCTGRDITIRTVEMGDSEMDDSGRDESEMDESEMDDSERDESEMDDLETDDSERDELEMDESEMDESETDDSERDESWKVYKATLPVELQGAAPMLVGSLSTGQLLLANVKVNGSITPVYAYDNKFERFVVGKIPQSLDWENRCKLGIFEQDIGMLEALIHRFGPRY